MSGPFQFSAADIQTWAGLVGDYNPIHFDEDLARGRGLEGVVAHGMLSLLRLKHAASQTMAPPAAEQAWVKVKARFRNPVVRAVAHQIDVRSAGQKSRFSLTRCADGLAAMDGTMNWTTEPPEPGQTWKAFDVPDSKFDSVLGRFRNGYPGVDSAWLALDCLLFELLLQNEIPFQLAKELGLAQDCESQSAMMHEALTVQSSHSLHVRAELMGANLDAIPQLLPLRCTVLMPTVSAPDASQGFVASCQMQLHSPQLLLIQSDVGLVVRTLPQPA